MYPTYVAAPRRLSEYLIESHLKPLAPVPDCITIVADPKAKTGHATSEIWHEVRAILQADRHAVDKLGLWKDTVAMLFTDHGQYLSDHV
ncbi:hypothetical protein MCOR25_005906 [Pyricularia grisea]|nr:hypothetical protein MCOR25_005906 [Pyricularia grisea]